MGEVIRGEGGKFAGSTGGHGALGGLRGIKARARLRIAQKRLAEARAAHTEQHAVWKAKGDSHHGDVVGTKLKVLQARKAVRVHGKEVSRVEKRGILPTNKHALTGGKKAAGLREVLEKRKERVRAAGQHVLAAHATLRTARSDLKTAPSRKSAAPRDVVIASSKHRLEKARAQYALAQRAYGNRHAEFKRAANEKHAIKARLSTKAAGGEPMSHGFRVSVLQMRVRRAHFQRKEAHEAIGKAEAKAKSLMAQGTQGHRAQANAIVAKAERTAALRGRQFRNRVRALKRARLRSD